MSEHYQPIYDAVRSKIHNGDVGAAISEVARNCFDLGNLIPIAQQEISIIGYQLARPSAVFRPTLARDGAAWIALYGDNLQVGVVGVGDSPEEAMTDFDKNWHKKIGA